jgi:nitrogen fixation/metabolism regulation signal transduction histidine kinase
VRIKTYFTLLVLLLLTLGGTLIWLTKEMHPAYLYGVEAFCILTLIVLSFFYRKIITPLNSIGSGIELLREQDFSSRLRTVGQYETDRIIQIFNRMMDQLHAERLRQQEQNFFLNRLIEASPLGIIIPTPGGEFSSVNPAALKMLGISPDEATGKLRDLRTPLMQQLVSLKKDETKVVRLTDASVYRCTQSSFIDRGFARPFYIVEPMTEEVVRVEKQAYEKVIRMIAHEVNNSITGITSTLDSVGQTLAEFPRMDDVREVMRVCIERCYSMSRFITRFADVVKIPEPMPVPSDLNDLIRSSVRFMQGALYDKGIELCTEYASRLHTVSVDPTLFEQVLLNIIKNAAESIDQLPDRTTGIITVRTLTPAVVEVEDNGAGITPEAASKLFTPFFSTKPQGQGIGLIFIREVLTRHKCTFSLRTGEDGLTRFRITFPFA